MQRDLLQKYPSAELRVYAVWFDMVPGDSRSRWPADLLDDPRVAHRWDQAKTAGSWYAERAPTIRRSLGPGSSWSGGRVLWDAFLLYGSEARWGEQGPGPPVLFGRTIVAGREALAAEIERRFAAPPSASSPDSAP